MVLEKLIITRSINDIEMKYTYSLTKESLNIVLLRKALIMYKRME